MSKLHGIKACVFDALGTLIDEAQPVRDAREDLAARGFDDDKLAEIERIWQPKTLEYLWLRSVMGALDAPGNAGEEALDYAMAVAGLDDCDVRERFLQSPRDRRFCPDVEPTLHALRERGFQTAILSGSSVEHLGVLIEDAGLDDAFDAVFSAGGVSAVKPDPRTYRIATDELGLPKQAICFVSGNPWDAAGAAHFGFHVVPIVRHEPYVAERLPAHPHLPSRMHRPIRSLRALTDRLAAPCSR